jgi:hypothetical protein
MINLLFWVPAIASMYLLRIGLYWYSGRRCENG